MRFPSDENAKKVEEAQDLYELERELSEMAQDFEMDEDEGEF